MQGKAHGVGFRQQAPASPAMAMDILGAAKDLIERANNHFFTLLNLHAEC